jgi:hypothetical protein
MTFEEATQKRDQHRHLIGKKAKDIDANIYDVIVVPQDGFDRFLSEYRTHLDDISNDEMLLNYPSKEYGVKVIYDYDPEFVDIVTDDLDEYLKR